MIDSMYQDRINANLDDQVKRPSTVPPPAAGLWTNFSSGFGGLPAGLLDAGASTMELSHGAAQSLTATGTMTGQGMFAVPTDDENAQAEKARNQIALHGVDFKSATADALRAKSAQFMPNAQTTGQAGQIFGSLLNFGGQAVAAGTAGPAGLIDLGVNRAMTKNDELQKQGVDFNTRAAVSAVSGGTDAASMLLPLSGATAWIRAGKGAAGGVASSVASTEAQKLILEHQGYSAIASTMDPFDPVSLALSALVPAGFGAAFGHGAKAPGMARAEPTAADFALTPAEQAHSDAVEASTIDTDIASLHTEIAKQKDAGARAVLQTELDRLTKQKQAGVAQGLAQDPNNVAAARTLQVADAIDSSRLTPDDDLGGYTAHTQALESAADSIARGQPVDVGAVFADPAPAEGMTRLYSTEPVEGAEPARFSTDPRGARSFVDVAQDHPALRPNGEVAGAPEIEAARQVLQSARPQIVAEAVAAMRAERAPEPLATKPDHASFQAAKAEAESGEPRSGAAPRAEAAGAETGPAPAHLAAAAAEMARLNPDMLVHLDGLEAPMRVGDLLEHLDNEAKATKREAGLLETAARCALSFGAT